MVPSGAGLQGPTAQERCQVQGLHLEVCLRNPELGTVTNQHPDTGELREFRVESTHKLVSVQSGGVGQLVKFYMLKNTI